jgi:glycosyltransferase involved in cell wall biosynthesis
MNVLHVVQTYPPSLGGTQEVMRQISERLVADYGDQVTVYTTVAHSNTYFWDAHQPALPQGETWQNGVRVVRFPVFNRLGGLRLNVARIMHRLRLPYEDWARGLYFGPIVPGLRQAIAGSGAEIVMASAFPLLHMHDAVRGAQDAQIPAILLGAFHTEDRWAFERRMVYNDIRQCAIYIAYTGFERDYLLQRGIDAAKIRVIGGGIEPERYRMAERNAVRQRLGWGEELVIVSVAQHLAHKRLDLLITAMPRVWETVPDARLVIVGSPAGDTPHLERLLARLAPQQRERVILAGQQSFQEKVEWLAAADIFAMLSNHESFGLVFLEAWASGLPVIGSNAGAISSVIKDEVDGLLVPYGNSDAVATAILRLWQESALRAQMSAAGQTKIKAQYTWDIVVQRFREVYCEAIAHPRMIGR